MSDSAATGPFDWSTWEQRFVAFLRDRMPDDPAQRDAAHDLAHVRRVVANARHLAEVEGADLAVVMPAAWLHDCVVVAKNSPDRAQASRLAAAAASHFLNQNDYPAEKIPAIAHAIEAHSFSAGIPPRTLEAQVVQDADRLDSLGAIGIARTFVVGGMLGTQLYNPDEPLPVDRRPDDGDNVIDHFYVKLLKLAGRMNTSAGRKAAEQRTAYILTFLDQFGRELTGLD